MTSDRIKEIQEQTAYPESVSIQQALLQVWNECEQERTKAMEEYKNQSQWISVKERLPEKNQRLVLVCNTEEVGDYAWVCCGQYHALEFGKKKKWYNQFSDEEIIPTHWMPLPNSPIK